MDNMRQAAGDDERDKQGPEPGIGDVVPAVTQHKSHRQGNGEVGQGDREVARQYDPHQSGGGSAKGDKLIEHVSAVILGWRFRHIVPSRFKTFRHRVGKS